MVSKVYFLAQFYVLSKTENSRRVTESRLVCVGLYEACQMKTTPKNYLCMDRLFSRDEYFSSFK